MATAELDPNGDVSTGGWTSDDGGVLYDNLDDGEREPAAPSNVTTDYAQSAGPGGATHTCELDLGTIAGVDSVSEITVWFYAGRTAGTLNVNLNVWIKPGGGAYGSAVNFTAANVAQWRSATFSTLGWTQAQLDGAVVKVEASRPGIAKFQAQYRMYALYALVTYTASGGGVLSPYLKGAGGAAHTRRAFLFAGAGNAAVVNAFIVGVAGAASHATAFLRGFAGAAHTRRGFRAAAAGDATTRNAFRRAAAGTAHSIIITYTRGVAGAASIYGSSLRGAAGVHRSRSGFLRGAAGGSHTIYNAYARAAAGVARISAAYRRGAAGLGRIRNDALDRFELYVGADADPDFTAAPAATQLATYVDGLPTLSPALVYALAPAALGETVTYRLVLRLRNGWGLASENLDAWTVEIDDAGQVVATPPSAPDSFAAAPGAAGTIVVTATYTYTADGDDQATRWLVYLTTTGVAPDPATDTPTVVVMSKADGVARLTWTSSALADATVAKVLVRTRRIDAVTGNLDSTNLISVSATAETDGPAAVTRPEVHIGDRQEQ